MGNVRDSWIEETVICPDLAALIDRFRPEIAAAWADRVISLTDTHYSERARDEVSLWASDGIDALQLCVQTGSTESFQAYLETIGRSRLQLGFEMQEVVQAWLHIKNIITPYIIAECPDDPDRLLALLSCLDSILRFSAARFVAIKGEHLRTSYTRLTETLLKKQGFSEVLNSIALEGRRLVGARSAAVLLVDEGDNLYTAVESGDSIHDLSVILDQKLPESSKTIPDEPFYENILPLNGTEAPISVSSLLVSPLSLREKEVGILLAMNHPGGFNDDDLRMIRIFSDLAAIALEYAHLNEQHEKLAVLEERQKLARELHDSVSQSLYAMTLYAEASSRLLAEDESAKAYEHVIQLRDTSLAAMREMRLLVYELRPHVLEDNGLITTVRNRLQTVEERVGIETEIDISGFERLPLDIEAGLHGIIHESLNNTLKHTTAKSITVAIHLSDGTVYADVRDNGEGFDPAEGLEEGGLGLLGIQECARELNAILEIHSRKGEGTHIHVEVPLESRMTENG